MATIVDDDIEWSEFFRNEFEKTRIALVTYLDEDIVFWVFK